MSANKTAQTTATQQAIDTLSFEQALEELESIVRELEAGQANLDDSIAYYERGTQLKAHCQKKLDSAKLKVEKIMQKADGSFATEPLDADGA